jgi:NADPH:quinone reductase-like Zn-dependent oxidoreductase
LKAVSYDRYGGPEVLRLEDVPEPSPAAGQVLVPS